MKKKRFKKIIIAFVVLLGLLLGGVFYFLNQVYTPSDLLYQNVSENSYTFEDDFYLFNQESTHETGIIIYPGALVEPLSYGYIANELAKEGYFVAIAKMNLNLSIVDSNKADQIVEAYPDIDSWYIAGHSMGGVSACKYANDHQDFIDGVILLGSYPSSSDDLSDTSLDVLSIYGQYDGLTTLDDIDESKTLLPKDTEFKKIVGGNHAQFGLYGKQKGDNEAKISPLEQQDEIIDFMAQFLNDQTSNQ